MLQNVNWPTAVVAVAGIGGCVALAILNVPAKEVAGYGAAFIGLASALAPLFSKK